MIKIICTSDKTIQVFPVTGVTTPNGLNLPMVAPTSDKNVVLNKGESMNVDVMGIPAIGGNGGEFEIINGGDEEIKLIRWFELDNDPIYADEMQGYKDLNGQHTDDNYSEFGLESNGTYSDTTIRSNVITLTMLPLSLKQPK